MVLQYLAHYVPPKIQICTKYSLLFSVTFVWLYTQILTSSGAYDKKPSNTQTSCRTDRAGLIGAAPW